MNKDLAIESFEKVRDIPYRIPLTLNEIDECCSGKSILLKESLEKFGYKVRFRVCSFRWSSINLPVEVNTIPHKDSSIHTYLEILVNDNWITVDPTWDKGLSKIFHINEWGGESSTEIAVVPTEILSVETSDKIMTSGEGEVDSKDLEINGKFYKAFNNWLNNIRN